MYTVRRRVCTATTNSASDTLFQYPLPRDGDKTQLIGIEVITQSSPPPLNTLLRDLGTLSVRASEHTVVTLPVALLAALSTVHYIGTKLDLTFDFDQFIRYFPMSAFQWSSPFITIRVGSRSHVQTVRFIFDCKWYMENGYHRYISGNFRSPVQQILTQTRCSPTPTTQFVFPLHLSQPTKGFFLEAGADSIHLVDASGERRLNASEHIGDYVFVPIASGTDIHTSDIDSYQGSYHNTHETVNLKVIFAEPRSYASVHCLYRSTLCVRSGIVQPIHRASNGVFIPSPRWWPVAVKPLDPARAECPITYEHIGATYYQCDGCQYAFSSAAFCSYALASAAILCPMCRRTWTAYVQYRQMDSDL